MGTLLAALILAAMASSGYAAAEPLPSFVNDFTVVGSPHAAELKAVIPAMLSSKLDQEIFRPVEKKEQAEIEISGSYVLFGKLFTLDATVKSRDGQLYLKAMEQGEKEDDFPAALGRLAEKIGTGVVKGRDPSRRSSAAPVASPAKPAVPPATADKPGRFGELWRSQSLEGALVGIARGKTLAGGERELFIAGERALHHYLLGKELRAVAKTGLPDNLKIIGIDAADLDGDGNFEIYLTVIDRGTLASRVYTLRDGKLEITAESLPYFFRSVRDGNGAQRILVQEMGMVADFHGIVAELVKDGTVFTAQRPLKLPKTADIFNFCRFTDSSGGLFAVINANGYLTVTAEKGENLWQSSEKFGGSETFFQREAPELTRDNMGEEQRWVFLQQRMLTTSDNGLLLVRNEGPFVLGNMRSYNRHSLHLLKWNGTELREQFGSGQLSGYLADYSFDPGAKELLTLVVTQKEGISAKGRSVIAILAIDR